MSNATYMKKIEDEILGLKGTSLYSYRVKNGYMPVIGEGNLDANIMFVGEAPGENEAKCGKPFCGRSGKVLDELLASIGMDRKTVYVTSVVKDRPQDNRDPSPQEIALYGPFLDRQIDILKPKVIVALGRVSMRYLFEKFGLGEKLQPISKIHGKKFKGKTSKGEVTIIALYHPAVALYNGSTKKELIKDFACLKKYIV